MIQVGWNEIVRALGLTMEGKDLNLWRMALRAILIFIIGLIIVRIGDKRFLGRNTALDALLAVVLGLVLSRAVNGSAPFVPTIGAGFVLVGLHWLFSVLAFHSHRFGLLVKRSKRLLIKDGQLQWETMRRFQSLSTIHGNGCGCAQSSTRRIRSSRPASNAAATSA